MGILSQGDRHYTSAEEIETCCFCFPLRLGVFAIALFTFVFSIFYILDHETWEGVIRHFGGGYSTGSRVIFSLVEMSGVLFGLVGLVGAYYAKRGHVQTFNLWQFVRLGAWLWMYFIDVPLLRHCEDWVNDIDNTVARHGWNNVMYEIAMDGACPRERRLFYILSTLSFLAFAYLLYATFRYTDTIGQTPKHLLRVPKDLASGSFYAHSVGERSALQGVHGADYGAPGGAPPPGMPPPGMPPTMLPMATPGPMGCPQMYGPGGMQEMSGPVGMPIRAPF